MVFDILNLLTILVLWLIATAICKELFRYYLVPVSLVLCYDVSNYLQERGIAPTLTDHLPSVGNFVVHSLLYSLIFTFFISARYDKEERKQFIQNTAPKLTILLSYVYFLANVAMEVGQVTLFRDHFISLGYSGVLDAEDLIMLLIGILIMNANHLLWLAATSHNQEKI